MEVLNQGSICYGFRSTKYPDVCCYAVIISARCDIANDKISKLYYLTAVEARDWFCTEHGFDITYADHIRSLIHTFNDKIKKYDLNAEVLLDFSKENAEKVICAKISGKDQDKILSEYNEIFELYRNLSTFDSRQKAIVNVNESFKTKKERNPAVKFLDDITKATKNHYHFVPQKSYIDGGKSTSGLIVDLQEIGILSIADAKRICGSGIDFQCLPLESESPETVRLKNNYWLNNPNDFVLLEGTIKSPWCELLLQRFALDYIRVGVDGSTRDDYKELVYSIGKGPQN